MQQPASNRLLAHSKCLKSRFGESDLVVYNSGFTCTVVQGRDNLTENKVAIKLVQKKKLVSESEIERARCELKSHATLSHPNIVPLLGCEETAEGFITVTPFASEGDLHELTSCVTLTEEAGRNCISQITTALNYLHNKKGIVHGDIKPHNMLLQKIAGKYVLQLCDFGFSEYLRPGTNDVLFTQLRGTSGFFAPEQLAGRNYDGRVDMFALGVVAFTLLGGYEPFYPPDNMSEPVEFEPRYWHSISPEAKDFITQCLCVDPSDRMTAVEALNHPWMGMDIPKKSPRDTMEESLTPPPDSSIEFWNAKEAMTKGCEMNMANTLSNDVPITDKLSLSIESTMATMLTCGDVAAGPRR